jgi:SAM-dependent methyltransferase
MPCDALEVIVEPGHDAYGQLLVAALEGDDVVEIVERDDGFIDASALGPKLYLAPFRRWPSHHRRAMSHAKGRVLDVGAGAGRVSLHLQERGHVVVAIDNSPGAIEVCRRRGVGDARVLAFDAVDESIGTFNTIVLLGNNFGLFGSPTRAKRLLRRLHRMTSDDARIIVESRDVEARGGADAPVA